MTNQTIDVAIIMGSDSDLPIVEACFSVLDSFDVKYTKNVMSAHRTPHEVMELIKTSEANGCKIFIAAAGMAAHLAGAVAAHSIRPVIGIPIESGGMGGLDSLLSTVMMPPGVPVATVAVGKSGAKNSAILAVQILATSDKEFAQKLHDYKNNMREEVLKKIKLLTPNCKKSLDIYSSIEWLSAGKILAHPTEGIWGLGCDALNKSSFSKIYDLKKRPQNKSFILLIPSILSIKKYLKALSKEDLNFLNKIWPGHTTVLVKYNKNLPSHLCNDSGKIAIRVSNHLPIKQLLKGFNGFMISTSANISGQKNLQNPNQIIDTFDDIDLAYYDALSGEKTKPSSIIDLETRKVIRE